jgi:glycine betaine/choline ABC-type transport system substrate-binding protein
VGSKNSTEQAILGEIIAQHLEKKLSVPVVRRLKMGGTLLLHQSLQAGQVDVYPEDTGAALAVIFRLAAESEPDVAWERLRREYQTQYLVWMTPLGFETGFVMVVRGADARAARLKTLTDAAQRKTGWRLGVPDQFMDRSDAYPVLMRTYNLPLDGIPKLLDSEEVCGALIEKRIDLAAASSTDGALGTKDLMALRDDKGALTPSRAGLAVRAASLQATPGLREALEELSGKISTETMRRLNVEAGAKHRPADEVAKEFLHRAGL